MTKILIVTLMLLGIGGMAGLFLSFLQLLRSDYEEEDS